jgi:transcriptional regulator with XRE-family HTH domain
MRSALGPIVRKSAKRSEYGRGTGVPDPIDVFVGRRIRTRRVFLDMRQEELARRLGLTFQQVQKYEKGVNRVGAGRLSRIADVLNVPVSFFFSGDITPAPSSAPTGLTFLGTAGAVRLVRAYSTIEDPQIRRALVDLAEEVGGGRSRDSARQAKSEPRKRGRGRRSRAG